jgi:hypothetical protein
MFGNQINSGVRIIQPNRAWQIPGVTTPQKGTETVKPFVNPDVFNPTQPYGPDGVPQQPLWLPPFTGDPNIEIPNNFPLELPSFPNREEWTKLPTPNEIPDWSKTPIECPHPGGLEVNLPKHFPAKTFPDGVWYLS